MHALSSWKNYHIECKMHCALLSLLVYIIPYSDGTPSCPADVTITELGNYSWPETSAGITARRTCDVGPTNSFAFRPCDGHGNWMDVDITDCDVTFRELQNVSKGHL